MRKKDYRREAKVLLFDLEVSPTLSWHYGQYKTRSIDVIQAPILLSVAWKWLGEKGDPHCMTIVDKPIFGKFSEKTRWNHDELVRQLWKLMDEAEVIVAHNLAFDEKMSNAFFLRCGLNPPSWYKPFCTLKTAKRFFRLDNNTLNYLGQLLLGEQKTDITVKDLWKDILYAHGKELKRANKLLKEYNIQDVVLLEKIYNRLLPFASNHPNMALAVGDETICPRCGKVAEFKVKAYRKTGAQINAIQFQCQECGGYITRPLTKEEREELAETGKLKSIYRNITG